METGGVETNLVGLARELRGLGHDVIVVSSGGDLVGEVERAGARHVQMRLRLHDPMGLARSALALRLFISRERIDVAHSMSAAGSLALALSARGRGCHFVVSPMGLQNSDREPAVVTELRNRLIAFGAERVLVISDEIERAFRAVGVPPSRMDRTDVVGVDTGSFAVTTDARERVRNELGLESKRVVTTIGALHPRKSHDLFLGACRIVADADAEARFVIVGDGPERERLAARAHGLGLADHVRFAGRRRDVPALLAASDIYVKPGIVEGFIGITVLEAMAAGVPVVAFDTHDVRAAITPEETGLIVPARDTAALGKAILRLFSDARLRTHLAARGRELVRERFDLRAVAIGLVRRYSTMASKPCAG